MNLLDFISQPDNWTGVNGILVLLRQHVFYTAVSVLAAVIVAVPLGVLIGHTRRGGFLVIGLSNAARAIPTLGLLVLVVLLLSSGWFPIVLVLTILALPPILTATAAGIQGADPEAVYSARALGMTRRQVIAEVEWPLALPLVVSGVRSATLQVVATATVAAFTSAKGLGRLLISGQANSDYSEVFAGAVLVALLAIILDIVLGRLGRAAGRHARPKRLAATDDVPVPA